MIKKVTVTMRGGLGNQCFIYSAGRAFADRTQAVLCLDTSAFMDDVIYRREFELDAFRIRAQVCATDVAKPIRVLRKIRYQLFCRIAHQVRGYYCERKPFRYRAIPENAQQHVRLDGYWQSEKYFEDQSLRIVEDFQFSTPPTFENDVVAQQIRATQNSVFLHMRSYKEVPGKTDGSSALSGSYYINALEYLNSVLGRDHHIFVFSDDVKWAQRQTFPFRRNHFTFVDAPLVETTARSLYDFYLMRLCKHGILADSSFSWWAGWLGEHDWLARGERPIRIHVAKRCMNDDYWPSRWVSVAP